MPLYDWWGLNRSLFLWINGLHAPWWDWLMLLATSAGSARTYPYWIALAVLLTWIRPKMMPRLNVAVFATGFVATGFLVPWLKETFGFPRPLAALGRELVTVVGPPAQEGSFPSGHTTFVFLICVALSPGVPRILKWVLWIFAAAVALSRIVVGAHFPADVLGGAVLGVAFALVLRLALAGLTR